ncbi:MAG: hypothetical protein ACYCQJ_10755 [Nitrososphaerales archaeon]
MAHKDEIARRRDQVKRLYIRGLSSVEILNSIGGRWSLATIERDVLEIKEEMATWWDENSTIEDRFNHYLKERLDTLKEIEKEAWLLYHESPADDKKAKLGALGTILSAEKEIADTLGLSQTMSDMETQEKVTALEKELFKIKELIDNNANQNPS